MRIDFSRKFDKQLRKSPLKIRKKFSKIFIFFKNNPQDRRLRNHALKGRYSGCRSIDITGDWRAVYQEIEEKFYYFIALGTHSQLYG